MAPRKVVLKPSGADYEIHVLGSQRTPLRDFYHALLRLSWPGTVGFLVLVHFATNALFALLYLVVGGVENAQPGSFLDALFFSVQTMGTIGYGNMYPRSPAANWLVVLESTVGLALMALSTGLVFAKLSRPTARVKFSNQAVICPVNGVSTLMFRVGNERSNTIVNAEFHAVVARTERTAEGDTFYRIYDVPLARTRALTLNRSLTLMHPITPDSMFYGQTAQSIMAQEYELSVMMVGLDDAAMQTVHAGHNYLAKHIAFDARLVDVLTEHPNGDLTLDLTRFHEIEPLRRT